MTTFKTQTIYVSSGSVRYTLPVTITELDNKDISGDPIYCSLGTPDAAGTFVVPDLISRPSSNSVTFKLLVGGSYKPTAGYYIMWCKVTDNPEIPAEPVPLAVTIA